MLVLSRKLREGVVIVTPDGTRIRVSVADIDRNKIRLGFEAPKDVMILRDELVGNEIVPPIRPKPKE